MIEVSVWLALWIIVLSAAGIMSGIAIIQASLQARNMKGVVFGAVGLLAGVCSFLLFLTNTDGTTHQTHLIPLILSSLFLLVSAIGPITIAISWWENQEPQPEPTTELLPTTEDAAPELFDTLPEEVRTEHCVVTAGSGHGKSQLFQSLILDDLEKEATIIVIDSQSQLIEKLLHVVPSNRLTHLTPSEYSYPLALNLFDKNQDSSLYEYIFSALEAEMTSKQATVYRYLSRLVSVIPGATIDTMRILLTKGSTALYRPYIEKLNPIAQGFFNDEYEGRQYDETRQQISRRLYAVLENEAFAKMFMAPKMKLDIKAEIEGQKVILVDTAKRTLTGDAFKIFGRFIIAQIAKEVFTRATPYPHRVYIYIDEAQEYFSDEDLLVEMFTQARKQNVSLTVAFQYLAQVPDKVLSAVMANTAVKMVGKVSAGDRAALAKELGLKTDELNTPPKGWFVTRIQTQATTHFRVWLGRLESLPKRSRDELDTMRATMRTRYQYVPSEAKAEAISATDFSDFEDRS